MRTSPNISDGHISVQIGIPSTPQAATSAPRLLLQFEENPRAPAVSANDLRHYIIDTGIYSETVDDLDAHTPQLMYPFNYEESGAVISGKHDDEWALFGFMLDAWRLQLKYYSIEAPSCCGMIELGCNFSSLRLSIQTFDPLIIGLASDYPVDFSVKCQHYDIHLRRRPKQVQRSWIFCNRRYTECASRAICTAIGQDNQHQVIWRRELSGRDFVYPLF